MNDVSLILTGNTKRVKLFLTTLKAMLKISKHRAWSHWKLFQAFHTWLTAFFKVFCIEISISRLNVTFDIALTHLAYVLLIFHNKYIKSHGFLDGNAWSSFLCGQTLKCGAQNILSYGRCLTDSRYPHYCWCQFVPPSLNWFLHANGTGALDGKLLSS